MSMLDNVDAVTNLAKNNEVQLLVFQIDDTKDSPFYAINVFKTREVVEAKRHYLTEIPSAHRLLEGTIVLRGLQVPIIDLPTWVDRPLVGEKRERSNILICDFNGVIIGLRMLNAYRVIKRNWNEMHAPDAYAMGKDNMVMNDTRLDDGSLCLILDFERLLAEVIPSAMVHVDKQIGDLKNVTIPEKLLHGTTLIAEDSKTAQRHLSEIFKRANMSCKIFNNGKLMIEYIDSLSDEDKGKIPAIISDIEMPEMSGFTVTRLLKDNPVTSNIPIVINSSMTGDNNKREAEQLGADGFIDKTKSDGVIRLIVDLMKEREPAALTS